jgi:flagellum-specific peptidoglycan hydrolase FlgJ
MNASQKDFLDRAAAEAQLAGHIYPQMAACEAALESGYGASKLAREANNLFGMKQHSHALYGTLSLPTREFVGLEKDLTDGNRDGWITVTAEWVSYPDLKSCFADRKATLERLANAKRANGTLVYPHYNAALRALSVESYITEVSTTWSTDPERARKVLSIYLSFAGVAGQGD